MNQRKKEEKKKKSSQEEREEFFIAIALMVFPRKRIGFSKSIK